MQRLCAKLGRNIGNMAKALAPRRRPRENDVNRRRGGGGGTKTKWGDGCEPGEERTLDTKNSTFDARRGKRKYANRKGWTKLRIDPSISGPNLAGCSSSGSFRSLSGCPFALFERCNLAIIKGKMRVATRDGDLSSTHLVDCVADYPQSLTIAGARFR